MQSAKFTPLIQSAADAYRGRETLSFARDAGCSGYDAASSKIVDARALAHLESTSQLASDRWFTSLLKAGFSKAADPLLPS